MTKLDAIQKAAAELSPEELAKLRAFLDELAADDWDAQIERDAKAGNRNHDDAAHQMPFEVHAFGPVRYWCARARYVRHSRIPVAGDLSSSILTQPSKRLGRCLRQIAQAGPGKLLYR